ncbi:MAG: flavodoxin family protein [Planctomycetota bacterium]
MNRVLVIVASPRKGGNSDILADRAAECLSNSGVTVDKVYLSDININPCKGCLRCNILGRCVQNDDFGSFLEKLTASDAVVISSPVYFYTIPGQLKTLIDRFRSVMHVSVLKERLDCKSTMKGKRNFLIILVQGEPKGDDYKDAAHILKTFSKRVAKALKISLLVAKGLPMKGQVKMDFDALKSTFEKLSLPADKKYVLQRMRHNQKIIERVCKLSKALLDSQ